MLARDSFRQSAKATTIVGARTATGINADPPGNKRPRPPIKPDIGSTARWATHEIEARRRERPFRELSISHLISVLFRVTGSFELLGTHG
jgi:hypothetical protein